MISPVATDSGAVGHPWPGPQRGVQRKKPFFSSTFCSKGCSFRKREQMDGSLRHYAGAPLRAQTTGSCRCHCGDFFGLC